MRVKPAVMMPSAPIPGPLTPSRFLQRHNRFLIQVRLDDTGEVVDVHMADPGRLRELLLPGKRIWLRPAGNPERKTRWTAVLVESPSGNELVSLDTTLPNRLIAEALRQGTLEEFEGWGLERPEFVVGRSRLDFLLSHASGRKAALEVKSVTLVNDGVALFPDAITKRGTRHLGELQEIAEQPGWEAAVLFVLQRWDARRIRAAKEIDLRFAEALEEAHAAGVRLLGRRCRVGLEKVELGPPVPVEVG